VGDKFAITYTEALGISVVGGSDYKSLVLAHCQILGALSREVAEAIKTVSKK